jgi:hypothetical protein
MFRRLAALVQWNSSAQTCRFQQTHLWKCHDRAPLQKSKADTPNPMKCTEDCGLAAKYTSDKSTAGDGFAAMKVLKAIGNAGVEGHER